MKKYINVPIRSAKAEYSISYDNDLYDKIQRLKDTTKDLIEYLDPLTVYKEYNIAPDELDDLMELKNFTREFYSEIDKYYE